MNIRDKIKGRRLNWAEVGATRFPDFLRSRHCEIGGISLTRYDVTNPIPTGIFLKDAPLLNRSAEF